MMGLLLFQNKTTFTTTSIVFFFFALFRGHSVASSSVTPALCMPSIPTTTYGSLFQSLKNVIHIQLSSYFLTENNWKFRVTDSIMGGLVGKQASIHTTPIAPDKVFLIFLFVKLRIKL